MSLLPPCLKNLCLAGFDCFGQLSVIHSKLDHNLAETISEVSFAWSVTLLSCVEDGKGSSIFLSGMYNEKKMQLEKLLLPVEGDEILNVTCNSKFILALTKNCNVWKYTLSLKKWDNVTSVLFADLTGKDTSFDEVKPFVRKIASSEGMNVSLLSNGLVLSGPNVIANSCLQMKIEEIAVGTEHALFLSECGLVYTYGSGGRGQLGHGELDSEETLREVRALSGLQISQVTAGGWHSIVLSHCGDLYGWGWNNWGQLSLPPNPTNKDGEFKGSVVAEPALMHWPSEDIVVVQVATGTRHTVALLDNGSVWGCGWNAHNQLLGLRCLENASYPLMTELKFPGKRKVRKIACGAWNSAFWFS